MSTVRLGVCGVVCADVHPHTCARSPSLSQVLGMYHPRGYGGYQGMTQISCASENKAHSLNPFIGNLE
jgi:hypothetical protein